MELIDTTVQLSQKYIICSRCGSILDGTIRVEEDYLFRRVTHTKVTVVPCKKCTKRFASITKENFSILSAYTGEVKE